MLTDVVGIKKSINLFSKKFEQYHSKYAIFYAFYFYYINKNFINKKNIKKILFEWFDKKNEKDTAKSKHDYKINQIEDVFYHFYSILKSSTKIDNLQIKGKVKNLKNIFPKLDSNKKIS